MNEQEGYTSVSISKKLYERIRRANKASASLILSLLAEKWLKGEVEISLKPKEGK